MSGYLEKSKQSTAAAMSMMGNSFHTASVHSFYYSCVQNILHILFVKLKHDKVQFVADMKHNHAGTHLWASKLIGIEIAHKDAKDYKWFQRVFSEMKELREKADYSEDVLTQDFSYTAKKNSESINNLLNTLFK